MKKTKKVSRDWTWNASRDLAAALVADDSLTQEQVAGKAGVGRATLGRWVKIPEFEARVLEIREKLRQQALATALQGGIADLRERVRGYNDRRNRMMRVIERRAKDPKMQKAAGGDTGLLVRQRKAIGQGRNNEKIDEFAVDTGLLDALLAVEKQAAQDLGQWIDKYKNDDYNGELADWTAEEIEAQRELNKRIRERIAQSRTSAGPVAGSGAAAPATK